MKKNFQFLSVSRITFTALMMPENVMLDFKFFAGKYLCRLVPA